MVVLSAATITSIVAYIALLWDPGRFIRRSRDHTLSRYTPFAKAKQTKQTKMAVPRLRSFVRVFNITTTGIVMLMQPTTIQNLADSDQRSICRAPAS